MLSWLFSSSALGTVTLGTSNNYKELFFGISNCQKLIHRNIAHTRIHLHPFVPRRLLTSVMLKQKRKEK